VWGSQDEAFAEIEEIERHSTIIFPETTATTCSLASHADAHTWTDWAEIVDSGAATLSSKMATVPGYIAALLVEDASIASAIFMVEIAYGEAKTIVSRHRLQTETNKLPSDQVPRVRGAIIPAGETIYYRCMCELAGPNTLEGHFRYYLCHPV